MDYKNCIWCGKKLEGKQSKFCCQEHGFKEWHKNNRKHYNQIQAKRMKPKMKELYNARKTKGLCITCGKKPAKKGLTQKGQPFSNCSYCIAWRAGYNASHKKRGED